MYCMYRHKLVYCKSHLSVVATKIFAFLLLEDFNTTRSIAFIRNVHFSAQLRDLDGINFKLPKDVLPICNQEAH